MLRYDKIEAPLVLSLLELLPDYEPAPSPDLGAKRERLANLKRQISNIEEALLEAPARGLATKLVQLEKEALELEKEIELKANSKPATGHDLQEAITYWTTNRRLLATTIKRLGIRFEVHPERAIKINDKLTLRFASRYKYWELFEGENIIKSGCDKP